MKESIRNIKLKAGRRARRVRAKIRGSASKPRLSVHISNAHISAQCIDDVQGKTLLHIDDSVFGHKSGRVKVDEARLLGQKLAELALSKGFEIMVFDRGKRSYHGRVKMFVDGARAGGIKI